MPYNTVPCCHCNKHTTGRYREVTGWEEIRAQGGANKIIGRKETGRYCCEACMYNLKHGLAADTPQLL